ncbi:TadE/TadG family type IV pilus assembly protein [Altererythrobacter sp. MTPC7]|uniref:TadE/TadG family type IV pilus assembly protein n=1 Tax=Altererythrobacter sp. MTPC7 TaxID=3056567 RepID=UPI0036F2CE7C
MTEFALAAPLLLGISLYGMETAYLTVVHMKVNQAAIHVADNASRIGDVSTLDNRAIYEADINDLLVGVDLQVGNLDIFEHGRVIISSLETNPDNTAQQWIHWQRCKGKLGWVSTYGQEGVKGGSFQGMGPMTQKVKALPGDAVMFVEIAYDFQPLFGATFVGEGRIHAYSSFTVRADRDLTQIYQRDTTSPDPVASCTTFDDLSGEAGSGGIVNPGGGMHGPGGGPGGGSSGGGGTSGGGGGGGGGPGKGGPGGKM